MVSGYMTRSIEPCHVPITRLTSPLIRSRLIRRRASTAGTTVTAAMSKNGIK
jgi:hypothetical protein